MTLHVISRTLLAAAALAVAGGVDAQAPEPAPAEKTIVVEAPRSLPAPPSRSPFSGAPVIVTTVRISALYGDLDLAKPDHAARLMLRIERVAQDACRELDRLYPLSPDPDCVARAVAGATPAVEALVAGAAQ